MVEALGGTPSPSVTTQSTKKCAVRRAGVSPMQAIDNMQAIFIRFQRTDWLGKSHPGKRTAGGHSFRNTRRWVETLILHEEDYTLGCSTSISIRGCQ